MNLDLRQIKKNIVSSIYESAFEHGNRNPIAGETGNKSWRYPKHDHDWTASFFTGQLWLSYMLTGETYYKNRARMKNEYLQSIIDNPARQDHDLGFLFSLSAVADYKLTGDQHAKTLALRSADALRIRFNNTRNFIEAWNAKDGDMKHYTFAKGRFIIDSIQNLPLLIWAWEETNIQSYYDVATKHLETLKKYIVRDDYSTYHSFVFDPTTMEPVGGRTVQGYKDESCWSRGQAWAIHGFAQMYEKTKDISHLELSVKLADYAIAKMEENNSYVPLWDYLLDDDAPHYMDTSAGAITASGLFIIADNLEDPLQKEKYRNIAFKMLEELHKKYDVSTNQEIYGLLIEGCSHVPNNVVNNMLPYGDYYYFEAVLRGLSFNKFFW